VTDRVLALLGTGLVDPDAPVLRADDLGVVRGDGIFETLLVRQRAAWLLEEHLARFARSAQRMDLPLPPLPAWRQLVGLLLSAWHPALEGALRLVCTRGLESGSPPVGYGYLAAVSADTLRQRQAGVGVITLDLGVAADARARAPWLLAGVKSTSYAVNMAAQRYARTQGADDVIYRSIEGEVLEGPTATVVWATGERLVTVPTDTGILPGTTAAYLFEQAKAYGFDPAIRRARVDELHDADAVWLVSSVRGAVPVVSLDGRPRGDGGLTTRIHAALGLDKPVATVPYST
jgi:4-amino-4-deoxychorismate lyase